MFWVMKYDRLIDRLVNSSNPGGYFLGGVGGVFREWNMKRPVE
jgi:hypothetical protein